VPETKSLPTAPLDSIRLIWEPDLCEALGRSRYTVARWVEMGILPPPLAPTQQSRCWRLRDIEAALDRIARSRKKPKPRGALMEGTELVSRGADHG
jgi:hypothetical protein